MRCKWVLRTSSQYLPPPSRMRGRLNSIKYWTQCNSTFGVKLKQACGSPAMPSVPHWHTTAEGRNFSLTADITLQSHVLHLCDKQTGSSVRDKVSSVAGCSQSWLNSNQCKQRQCSHDIRYHERVQQLTGLIGWTFGTTYVRQVSCWTTFILIR